MTWEPRPLPVVTPETEPFWAGAADDKLLLNRCVNCGLTYHYPRAHCPDCLSSDVEWIEAEGTGEVYSYTVTSVVKNWPEDRLPLVNAYVELREGPRVLSAIVGCDSEDVAVGVPVEVQFVPTKRDDIAIPVFELAET